jgi:N-acetylmuramoyl-L-alanine amidase
VPRETWISLSRWCRTNDIPAPVRLAGTQTPAFIVTNNNGTLVIKPWSHQARWNGLELRLGFAPQLINGDPVCHRLDLEKNLRPLLIVDRKGSKPGVDGRPGEQAERKTIVIDPGHGGENAGTKSVLGAHYEKEFTLDWAKRLSALLIAKGWQVILTRTNDTDLALSNRVAVAEANKADLFLSLHFNSSAPNEVQAGLETYCLTPTGMASTITRQFEDDAASVFPNNAFDAQNLQLGAKIHTALLQVNGNRDRGLRRARYLGVLRGQQRPAVLIEAGYLSNPREARQIADPAYREKLAEAIANALTEPTEGLGKPMLAASKARPAEPRTMLSERESKPPIGQAAVILAPNLSGVEH